MRFKVSPLVAHKYSDAVECIREILDLFDTHHLSEFKIRYTNRSVMPGSYGNCKYPGYRIPSYRISCSVKGTDRDFPAGPYKHAAKRTGGWSYHHGTLRQEHVAASMSEIIMFITGHELYHFLAHSRQIVARERDETNADLLGYEFMYSWREGIEPVELAMVVAEIEEDSFDSPYRRDRTIASALSLAPNRIPYTGMPEIGEK